MGASPIRERLADACAVLSVVRRTMTHVSQGDPDTETARVTASAELTHRRR